MCRRSPTPYPHVLRQTAPRLLPHWFRERHFGHSSGRLSPVEQPVVDLLQSATRPECLCLLCAADGDDDDDDDEREGTRQFICPHEFSAKGLARWLHFVDVVREIEIADWG
ncbi:unnamed protein product [Heligmosomoides polygyrus]|uniref:Uncharacterized protein n=1 Tax=Heligmosomoides polygyrus TaxID=6339 RepID=A0A183FQN2_HELPZ|nr:unnamed protein product [Heligmosomoides polygyrus]